MEGRICCVNQPRDQDGSSESEWYCNYLLAKSLIEPVAGWDERTEIWNTIIKTNWESFGGV